MLTKLNPIAICIFLVVMQARGLMLSRLRNFYPEGIPADAVDDALEHCRKLTGSRDLDMPHSEYTRFLNSCVFQRLSMDALKSES
ncbi:hypothetical protein X801_02782 [Opisthorchis viverrini]|uniref:Uncharacterized protein n=2 Tax=Opisthorchis viverrini TaxID=6198 RepID=A0A1S8X4E1_OPIVI|nr:hypothetical protein T265_13664 [Opisthorchis viverrini]KER28034.1 hypothetical protein T265_13664 [Opisthorchis viverrini]OON21323.1 hypothetical protein X801_02782 [Opisthorchis viverrini]